MEATVTLLYRIVACYANESSSEEEVSILSKQFIFTVL